MIAGIVLAAGRSRRMGEPKALLRLEDRTFLERAVTVLRDAGCEHVAVVVAGDGPDGVASEAIRLGASLVVNPYPDAQQIDSLRLGLRSLPDEAHAAMVLPVDVPAVSAELARSLVEAYRLAGSSIVVPAHDGRHGHPVLFARRVWPELMQCDLAEGARSVIQAHASDLLELPVEGLAEDVDTPEDFARLAEPS